MLLKLIDMDSELSVEIPIDNALQEAVMLQILRLSDQGRRLDFGARLASHMMRTVREVLDPDLQGPTDAQLSYALAISKQVGVSLPSDALRYKGSMSDFIGRYEALYRERQRILRSLSDD